MSDTGTKIDLTEYDKMRAMMAKDPLPGSNPTAPITQPTTQGSLPASIPEDQAPPPVNNELTTTMSAGQPKGGLLAGIAEGIGKARDLIAGVSAGAARIPGTVAGGLMDAAADLAPKEALRSWGSTLLSTPEIIPGSHAIGALTMLSGAGLDRKGVSYENIVSSKDYLGRIGDSSINQGVATIGSLVLGSEGLAEVNLFRFLPKAAISEGAVEKIAKSAANFGIASGVLMDPNEVRLSSALNNLGIHSEFTDWLGADPSQSSRMENRFKNAVEGVIGGLAADTVFQGAKYLKSVLDGTPNAAAHEAATAAAKELIPEAAHPAESQVAAVRGAGTMEVRVDGQPVASMPSEQYNGLVQDAERSFTTTPGAIAMEHEAEVSSLEAQATEAATPAQGYTLDRHLEPIDISDGKRGAPFGYTIKNGDTEVGQVYGNYDAEANHLHIESIKAGEAGSIGTANTRQLLSQVRADFPDAVTVGGERISGARGKVDPLKTKGPEIRVPLTPPLTGLDNEAVAPLLRSMAIKLHDTPHVVRPDAVRDSMAMDAAREVGVDPTDMIAYAQHVAGDVSDIDVATTATQILWRKIATDLDAMSLKGIAEGAPEHEIAAHKTSINNAVAFSGSFQDIRSALGRGLRSTSVFRKAADYIGDKLGVEDAGAKVFKETNPIPPQPNTVQDINDFYSMWNDLKSDAQARQNLLRGIQVLPSQWKYLRTSFANNFTANALAGLPSLSMNTVGPIVIGMQHTMEKTLGGFANALNPLLSASDRAANLAVATNAARAYIQTVGDIPDAFRYAWQAARDNRAILGGSWSIDVGRMGPITDQMLRASRMADGPTIGYQLGNLINYWPRNFQRINAGLDEFAKRLSYMGEVRLNAATEYDLTIAGTDRGYAQTHPNSVFIPAREAYIKSAMENSIDSVGEATNEAALRSAERTTLTGELSGASADDYHPLVGRAANLVQAMRTQIPETRYIIPVFNVPANALGETLRRIPGVNYLFGETRAELSGELGPVRQADAYGRTMLGAAFLLWAFHHSRQGQLTGSGPTDPANRKAWSDQGYMPYSIRMGDKWVDYSRYDLPGATLGVAANMYDSTVYHRQDDPSYEARAMATIGSLAQYFKDKAALQGASNMMNFGASPGADESFLNRTLNSVATRSLIPNFVTQLGRNTTDDYKRSATSVSEALMNAFPMTSKELDPMRNVLGEPLHVPRDSILENVLPITISPATTFKSDPVMSELDRLRQATGDAPGVTHPSRFDGGYYDSTQVKLEDGHSLYDHLVGARQTIVDPDTGFTLRAALTKMFASPEYKTAKDADASNLVDSDGNVSRGAIIAKYFDAYNKAAIKQVAQESPIAKHMLAITLAKKIDDDRLRPYDATSLSTNPTLLKALGIDINKYEQKVSGQ